MKLFSFILLDIKRLLGHGKTAVLAIFSPVIIILLFAVFLVPLLSAGEGAKITCAYLNKDDTDSVRVMMNMIVEAEIQEGRGYIYPVKDIATGKNLVEENKVSAFFYIPPNMYNDAMSGKKTQLDYYYSRAHSFESYIFYTAVNSSLSVLGEGIRMVYIAGEIAMTHGVTAEEIIQLWNEGSNQLFHILLNRGQIIGEKGVFNPGGDYPLRFAVAALFALCSYFAAFPVIYLTNLDISTLYPKRNFPMKNLVGYYFARLTSGTFLILCTFFVMYPVARAVRNVRVRFALSVLPAVLLTALTFSALGILLGSLFRNGQSSLWAGLYFGILSILSVLFLSKSAGLPEIVSFFMRISPFRACVSIFSNALFQDVTLRYTQDMLVLLSAFLLLATAGFFVYVKRGSRG